MNGFFQLGEPSQIVQDLCDALLETANRAIVNLLTEQPKKEKTEHFSVNVSGQRLDVHEKTKQHMHLIYTEPKRFLPLLDEALLKAQQRLLENHDLKEMMHLKTNAHVRLKNLDPARFIDTFTISAIRCKHIGLYQVSPGFHADY